MIDWLQHSANVQYMGKRGFEYSDITAAFHKNKWPLQTSSQNKHQFYKKAYIYFFTQLMFIGVYKGNIHSKTGYEGPEGE